MEDDKLDFGTGSGKPAPVKEQSPPGQSPAKKGMSRRDFLKLGGVAVVGAAIGVKVYTEDQGFFDKVGKSVREGKILQDVGEVIDSQFSKNEKLLLGNEVPYDFEWMEGLFESKYFFGIEGQERGRMSFLEITNNANVAVTTEIGGDLSLSIDNNGKEFMLLPAPQHSDNNRYLMYANFNKDGNGFSASQKTGGKSFGGLILQNNLIRVGYPEDFENKDLFHPYESFSSGEPNSAQVDYFFVLDSQTLEEDLATIKRGEGGKNMRNAQEFSSAIVTFFMRDGTFKTFVMSSFREPKPETGNFEPSLIGDFTIPQLASLARDFSEKNLNNVDRFMMAFPDPGPNQYMVSSKIMSLEEIKDSGMEPFLTRDVPEDEVNSRSLYRTFGGNASSSSVIRPVRALKPAYLVVSRD